MAVHVEIDAIVACRQARRCAHALGFDENDQTRIAIATSELCMSMVRHATGRTVTIRRIDDNQGPCLEVIARDEAPGINESASLLADCDEGQPQPGLGSVWRMMDDVRIDSRPRRGVTVTAGKRLAPKSL